jgi:transcriptional regulator with XRE-family HTH domain
MILINIGSLLREKRIEKNLSIDDIAQITKLTRNHIIAIENGDMEPFSKDLSYLSYYIRHYANAVGVDYDLLRDEVNEVTAEWTQTIDIASLPEHKKDKVVLKGPKKAKTKKIDYSFMAFIVASILLVVLLLYLGIRYLPGLLTSDPIEKPNITTPEVPNEKPSVEDPDGETPVPPVSNKDIEIVSIDDAHYEIRNWTAGEVVEFEVKFGAKKTWVALNVDGDTVKDPVSKVYEEDETIILKTESNKDRQVMFHLGVMAKNELYFEGKKIELTEKAANTKGVVKLYFTFVAEEGEV